MTPEALTSVTLAECEGESDSIAFREGRLLLRASELGRFAYGCRWNALALRRILLRLRVPPRLVSCLRSFVPRHRRDGFNRFVHQLAYWTGARRYLSKSDFRALVRGPVILMYHAVGRPGERGSCYVVSRTRFRLQMAWLKWSGFHLMSLADLASDLRCNRIPPRRSVVLTFDDGYADNCIEALPVLRRYQWPATVFVVSEGIGLGAWWPDNPALQNRPLISAAQLAEMRASGFDIGAHTRTHRSLTALLPQEVRKEIAGSREHLARIASPVQTFSYPFGDCSDAVANQVARAGFVAACCSRSGIAENGSPIFALPRVEVRGTDSLLQFLLLVWRGHRHQSRRTGTTLEPVTT